MPALAGDDVAASATSSLRPGLDRLDCLARDPLLHGLPVAVQLLELGGELASGLALFRQQQLERGAGPAEPARVDSGRIDPRRAHELAQARLLGPRQRAQAGDREPTVLVHERHDVGHRRERDQVEVPGERLRAHAEQRLPELPDDAGPAELPERVVAAVGPDDRARRELLPGAVVVGDDDLEPQLARVRDLFDRRHPAVDGEDEPDVLAGQSRQRVAGHAVALLEAARQVPGQVGSQLAEHEDGQGGRADPVGVVVAVDADPLPGGDGGADCVAGPAHVAEQERIVLRQLRSEEAPRRFRCAVAAPHEHAGRHRAERELSRKRLYLVALGGTANLPGAARHGRTTVRRSPDGARWTRCLWADQPVVAPPAATHR